jgi:Flp pilus assembly protein TadG
MVGRKFQKVRQFGRDERGDVLVEMAVVMPMFMVLVFGLVTLGFIWNNYVTLTAAAAAGARQFAVEAPTLLGGVPQTLSTTPYTDLQNTLKKAQYNGFLSVLNASPSASGGITITSVCLYPASSTCALGGTTCAIASTTAAAANTACSAALAAAVTSKSVVTVSTSYPCFIAIPIYFVNACTLTASASAQVQ